MFIRKWRYEQNLENARREGIREGKREANEQKFAYIEYLEEENKALQEKLVEAAEEIVRQWESWACSCGRDTDCRENVENNRLTDPDDYLRRETMSAAE